VTSAKLKGENIVSFADLYGGKLVAALDRQRPRDLFDVRDLLANEGIDATLRRASLVYILSHNRPMAEVVAPARLDVAQEFGRSFAGMTEQSATLADLYKTREEFIAGLVGNMPDEHRRLLISFEKDAPEWGFLDTPHAEQLPAVQLRLQNLAKIDTKKRKQPVEELSTALKV
jgi:hypothetical protein